MPSQLLRAKLYQSFLHVFLQVEDETSSANYGSSNLSTPQASHAEGSPENNNQQQRSILPGAPSLGRGDQDQLEEDTNKKDTAAADDLRELAAKGVCAPLWRTNQPVQPVRLLIASISLPTE